MIDTDLSLESVLGGAEGGCHDAGIVDQDVEFAAGFLFEVLGTFADGVKRIEMDLDWLWSWPIFIVLGVLHDVFDDPVKLLHVASLKEASGTSFVHGLRRFDPETRRASRNQYSLAHPIRTSIAGSLGILVD